MYPRGKSSLLFFSLLALFNGHVVSASKCRYALFDLPGSLVVDFKVVSFYLVLQTVLQ